VNDVGAEFVFWVLSARFYSAENISLASAAILISNDEVAEKSRKVLETRTEGIK
jgi:hypothetical protein